MLNAALRSQAEFVESQGAVFLAVAMKGRWQGREGVDNLQAAAEYGLGAILASSAILAKGWNELGAKTVEATKANSALTLELVGSLAKAETSDRRSRPARGARQQAVRGSERPGE